MNENVKHEIIKNTQICPMCGSEMKRAKTDSPHNIYTENRICANHECEYEMTICK